MSEWRTNDDPPLPADGLFSRIHPPSPQLAHHDASLAAQQRRELPRALRRAFDGIGDHRASLGAHLAPRVVHSSSFIGRVYVYSRVTPRARAHPREECTTFVHARAISYGSRTFAVPVLIRTKTSLETLARARVGGRMNGVADPASPEVQCDECSATQLSSVFKLLTILAFTTELLSSGSMCACFTRREGPSVLSIRSLVLIIRSSS